MDSSGTTTKTISVGTADGTTKDIPIYTDDRLRRWGSVAGLNNMCFRLSTTCRTTECKAECSIDEVEFRLFITVAPGEIMSPSTYGHEQWHLDLMIKTILKTQLNVTVACDDCNCDTCTSILREEVWDRLRPGFLHNWEHGNPLGPPTSGLPRGENRYPKGKVPKPRYPRRDDSNLPCDGKNGWFCSMDQVLRGDRDWPDVKADPDDRGPWTGGPIKPLY